MYCKVGFKEFECSLVISDDIIIIFDIELSDTSYYVRICNKNIESIKWRKIVKFIAVLEKKVYHLSATLQQVALNLFYGM